MLTHKDNDTLIYPFSHHSIYVATGIEILLKES